VSIQHSVDLNSSEKTKQNFRVVFIFLRDYLSKALNFLQPEDFDYYGKVLMTSFTRENLFAQFDLKTDFVGFRLLLLFFLLLYRFGIDFKLNLVLSLSPSRSEMFCRTFIVSFLVNRQSCYEYHYFHLKPIHQFYC
jgi:hypothetical protein